MPASNKRKDEHKNDSCRAIIPYSPSPFLQFTSLMKKLKYYDTTTTTTTPPPLPEDVLPMIFQYCDAVTLSRAACVSRHWNAVAHRDDLWEHLCRENFGVSASQIRPKPNPTKILYILTHRSFHATIRASFHGSRSTGLVTGVDPWHGFTLGQRIPM